MASTRKLETVEFTFEWYERLLETLLDRGYAPATFGADPTDGDVLIRHDVDLSPRRALEMGRLESEMGIRSTYFFLASNPLYNVFDAANREILAELDALGHRVGLHFSTHQHWSSEPSRSELVRRVRGQQSALTAEFEFVCEPISFHCPPEWALNRRFEGIVSTYEPRFFDEIGYHADSGQRWRDDRPFENGFEDRIQLLTHPGLWGETDRGYRERVRTELETHLDRTERLVSGQLLEDRFDVSAFGYAELDGRD